MSYLFINLVLAITWTFLTGDTSLRGFIIGFVLGFLALTPYRKQGEANFYSYRALYLFRFLVMFMFALFKSNIQVAWEIVTPGNHTKPSIVSVDTTGMSPLATFILANAISLTPGTMTIAVSRSSAKLYIHAMYGEDPDAVVHDIERMLKQPLLKVMPPKGDKHSTVMRGEV